MTLARSNVLLIFLSNIFTDLFVKILPLSLVPPSSMVICSASSDRDSSMVWLERSVNDRRFLILFIFSITGLYVACRTHRSTQSALIQQKWTDTQADKCTQHLEEFFCCCCCMCVCLCVRTAWGIPEASVQSKISQLINNVKRLLIQYSFALQMLQQHMNKAWTKHE